MPVSIEDAHARTVARSTTFSRLRRGDRAIELTRTEFTLLEMFLHRPRRVLDRSFILEDVAIAWKGPGYVATQR